MEYLALESPEAMWQRYVREAVEKMVRPLEDFQQELAQLAEVIAAVIHYFMDAVAVAIQCCIDAGAIGRLVRVWARHYKGLKFVMWAWQRTPKWLRVRPWYVRALKWAVWRLPERVVWKLPVPDWARGQET